MYLLMFICVVCIVYTLPLVVFAFVAFSLTLSLSKQAIFVLEYSFAITLLVGVVLVTFAELLLLVYVFDVFVSVNL